ncbi:MAG: serine hydroxymethyltransferase, partial [Bacteroidota bacterium]
DLRNKDLTGKDAQEALDRAGVTVNKNAVPFDDKSPLITSGIRIGTPALTTRGMKEREMEIVAGLIDRIISNVGNEAEYERVRSEAHQFGSSFPLYRELVEN